MHMVRRITDVKYYIKRTPECDRYLKLVTKRIQGEKFHSFVLFGLLKNGSLEFKDYLIDAVTMIAHELVEQVQNEFEEIPKEEFDKAETEYFSRESELSDLWRESQRKYYGIDIVTKEERDIMASVSRFLKKTKET